MAKIALVKSILIMKSKYLNLFNDFKPKTKKILSRAVHLVSPELYTLSIHLFESY